MNVWLDTPSGTIMVNADDIAVVEESRDHHAVTRLWYERWAREDGLEPDRIFPVLLVRTLRLKTQSKEIVILDTEQNRRTLELGHRP